MISQNLELELQELFPKFRELVSGNDSTLHYHSMDRYQPPAAPIYNTTPITTNYTASAGDFIPVDTTTGTVIITLPTTPAAGDKVSFSDAGGNAATINWSINPTSAQQIAKKGLGNVMVVRTSNIAFALEYVNAAYGWVLA